VKRPLASLASYENGYPFKPDDLGSAGTPVIRIRQLVDPSAEVDRHMGELPDRYVIDNGDLIFSWSGSLAVRFWDRGRSYLNQHLFRVDPSPGVDRRWLGWVLLASLQRLDGLMHGSAMTHITKPMLKLVDWDLPSLTVQRRIADFLDDRVARIDRIIAFRRQQAQLIDAAYQSWLDDRVSGYPAAPMRRFMSQIEQGWSPVADSVPAVSGEAGVLKLGSVRSGSFRPDHNKAFLAEDVPREEFRIQQGDLLVTRANTPTLVGDVAVVGEIGEVPLYLSDLIYRVSLVDYPHDLASAALRTSRVRQLIGVVARGTSGSMPKLRGEDLAALPIPVLPHQERAGVIAEDASERAGKFSRIDQIAASVALLAEYKTSLITAAVTGELDVTTTGSGIPNH
jgi:type I restriction enzyme, S subunit